MRTKGRLADGFKDALQRPLHHTIAHARNRQLPHGAVALWDLDQPMRLRVIGPGSYVSPDIRQEALDAPSLDVATRLPIEAGGSTIAFRLLVRFCQGFPLGHLPTEPPEPMRFV
jgi:hypothetical protein